MLDCSLSALRPRKMKIDWSRQSYTDEQGQSVVEKNQKLEQKLSHYEEEEERIKAIMKEKSILQAQNLKLKRSNSSMQARIRKLSETKPEKINSQNT